MLLHGCKGYAYNLFVEKKNLHQKYIRLLKDHIPQGTGKLQELNYTNVLKLESGKYYLCKVMTKLPNPIITFVIHNNEIHLSWSKKPCKSKQRWHVVKKTRKVIKDMNIRTIRISNISSKLKQLVKEPSLKLLNTLFGYNKSYVQPQNNVEDLLQRFKNAEIYIYS
jgi:hypothetical protein